LVTHVYLILFDGGGALTVVPLGGDSAARRHSAELAPRMREIIKMAFFKDISPLSIFTEQVLEDKP
jgi:S-methylmethionine-dependent homocysteine/selenocysteine methylase